MKILGVIAFGLAALCATGASAQTMSGMPAQPGMAPSQKAAQKAACERDARMIYRTGKNVTVEWRQQIKATRKTYVRDCLAKAGFAS